MSATQKIHEWKAFEFQNETMVEGMQSFERFKKVMKFENVDEEYGETRKTRKKLLDLNTSKDSDLTKWRVITDQEVGGTSTASIRLHTFPCDKDPNKTRTSIVFEGELRPLLTKNKPKDPWFAPRARSKDLPELIDGYAALVSPIDKNNPMTADLMDILAINVKSDGTPYFFNVIPDAFFYSDDIYQAKIPPMESMPELKVKWLDMDSFTLSSRGFAKYHQLRMPREAIKAFSFGVQGQSRKFRLEFEWIEARMHDYEKVEAQQEELKKELLKEQQEKEQVTNSTSSIFKRLFVNRRKLSDDPNKDAVYREYVKQEEEREKEEEQKKKRWF